MKIDAAIAYADQSEFVIEPIEIADPNPDEILIEIAGVGICHTDLFVRNAAAMLFKHPVVLGHEGAGTVVAIGSDITKVAVGDKVAVTFRSCGSCGNCETGPVSYCENFQELNMSGSRADGTHPLQGANGALASNFFGQSSFATHCLTYESNVVKVAEGIPVEIAGPLGCGIQTGAGAILNSLDVEAGSTVIVTGGGPVGQSAIMAAKLRGCSTIILVEPLAERRQFALDHGATHVIDPTAVDDLTAEVRKIVPKGLNYAFDTTGISDVLKSSAACLKARGALGMVGLSPIDADMPVKINEFAGVGIRVIGIIEGDSQPDEFLPFLMEQHLAGNLPFDDMVTTYPFNEINRAIEDQHDGKCLKAVLIP
ncbi:MAG: NAD(P)-dependent alcohol dehydrogenase [Pseudomonadota bacterium]